ncbi:hypothetical protein G9A89_012396 [Geosiphon pyriformis]|nr:hypothetical protein G9A89_012396 [Geosiphon pyriformis]
MELKPPAEESTISFSAGGSSSISAGLEFQSNSKKKACIKSIYSHSPLYKKFKNPGMIGGVVLWGSKVESEDASVSGVSDLKNINNIVAKEMSYMDSNNSEVNDMVDDMTLRKTQIRMYVLRQLPKKPSFNDMSDINNILELQSPKFQVKLFTLDVELSAILGKSVSDKLISIKKNFYQVDGFEGVSAFSKFSGIIRSSFTSELSLNKTKKMAICEKILVNNDVRKPSNHSDREIVVKKILVDLFKSAVESVFSKFGKIVSIKMQLIGLWQKALVEFESFEIADLVAARWFISRDLHQVLLYTLPVGMMAHDFSDLLESYDRKTCFIGCNLSSYVCNRCVIVCFVDEVSKLAAIGSTLVFKSVNLYWTGLSLAHCAYCKQFGHISTGCLLGGNSGAYDKWVVTLQNWVPIVCPVFFSRKTWTQVAGGSFSCMVSSNLLGTGLFSSAKHVSLVSNSLELLTDQVLVIMKKLNFVELVPLIFKSYVFPLVVLISVTSNLDSKMALNNTLASPPLLLVVIVADSIADLSLSAAKVLTTKVGGLESKMVALEVSVESVLERLDYLGLVNFLSGSSYVKMSTWVNSWDMAMTINFLFIFSNLVNAVVDCEVSDVDEFFDTDYWAVFVSVNLGGLLDMWLNSLYKQVNKNQWKFEFKGANKDKWNNFKGATLANTAMFSNEFAISAKFSDLDVIWDIVHKIMVFSANKVFKKKWFKDFDDVFTKESLRFYKLELLNIVNSGAGFNHVHSVFFDARKSYPATKLAESLRAKKANIRLAIDRKMESFKVNKSHTIRSVLECLFYKVVLDHLVVNNKLILQPNLVKSKINVIMKSWIRKCKVVNNISGEWHCQYQPLKYVFDEAFSGVMGSIEFNKLVEVVFDLLNGKAAGLLDVSNEL